MPRYADPPVSMSETVRDLADALALSPVRMAVMRELMQAEEGLTTGALHEGTGIARETLLRHLRGLEAAGLIVTDAGPRRAGHHLVYRADSAAVAVALEQLRRYVSGEG